MCKCNDKVGFDHINIAFATINRTQGDSPPESLNSKTENFTREDLLAVAANIGIRDANHIIEEVRSSVASWNDTAKDCGVRPQHIEAIGKTLLLEI